MSENALSVYDLDGKIIDPLAGKTRATVCVFFRSDCPISNRYAPEIQRLAMHFEPQGIAFWLVYVDPNQKSAAIRQHVSDYSYTVSAIFDPAHVLVQRSEAKITPQVAVFDAADMLVYSGRIDDRHIDFGQVRKKARHRELERVLQAIVAGASRLRPDMATAIQRQVARLR